MVNNLGNKTIQAVITSDVNGIEPFKLQLWWNNAVKGKASILLGTTHYRTNAKAVITAQNAIKNYNYLRYYDHKLV